MSTRFWKIICYVSLQSLTPCNVIFHFSCYASCKCVMETLNPVDWMSWIFGAFLWTVYIISHVCVNVNAFLWFFQEIVFLLYNAKKSDTHSRIHVFPAYNRRNSDQSPNFQFLVSIFKQKGNFLIILFLSRSGQLKFYYVTHGKMGKNRDFKVSSFSPLQQLK